MFWLLLSLEKSLQLVCSNISLHVAQMYDTSTYGDNHPPTWSFHFLNFPSWDMAIRNLAGNRNREHVSFASLGEKYWYLTIFFFNLFVWLKNSRENTPQKLVWCISSWSYVHWIVSMWKQQARNEPRNLYLSTLSALLQVLITSW